MTPDLKYLVWSAVLAFLQSVVAVLGAIGAVGLATLAGNREGLPPIEGWAGRAARAHRNMLESLVLFATLVLVVHVTQRANAQTALGAAVFFWARVAYAIVYVVGIPWVRTGVWAVSVAGLVIILAQLV
jgi:uncharacterized MAPEG superfamily protein